MSERQSRKQNAGPDQTRFQRCQQRAGFAVLCISVHVHPHAATHARLSGRSTPVMTRRTSSPSALSRHILDWDKCQRLMDQILDTTYTHSLQSSNATLKSFFTGSPTKKRLLECMNIDLYSLYVYSGFINIPYLCLLSCVLKET